MAQNADQKSLDTVDAKSVEYKIMETKWRLIDDLMGGTTAMREAGQTWLPKEPGETTQAYNLRLGRSFLYNAYRDTVKRLSSRPFSRPVTLMPKTIPDVFWSIYNDVDKTGKSLTAFAKDCFISCVNYGGTHILVDYPDIPEEANLAEVNAAGARATFTQVTPAQLIGWLALYPEGGGIPVLQRIRIYEKKVKPVGTYLDEVVEQIRVYSTTDWELWEKGKDDTEFKRVKSGTHTFGAVPLVTCYVNQTGYMMMEPPLEDLAWLNLAHWQSLSDQRNILRIARVGILFGTGMSEEEINKTEYVSANKIWKVKNQDANLKYVEHSGKAIGAGQKDLESLEERMEVLGLQPLIARSGNQTATGKAIDESKNLSDIQSWIRSLEGSLYDAFVLASLWEKVTVPDDFGVNIYNEFSLGMRAAEDMKTLLEARKRGDITHETFLMEIKRRGILAESVDIDKEIELTKTEKADSAMHTEGMPPDIAELGEEEPEPETVAVQEQ